MSRYFLHLKDSTDEVLDPDGTECLWIGAGCGAEVSA